MILDLILLLVFKKKKKKRDEYPSKGYNILEGLDAATYCVLDKY